MKKKNTFNLRWADSTTRETYRGYTTRVNLTFYSTTLVDDQLLYK